MTRVETPPHYPHLPYWECGGAGAVGSVGEKVNFMRARCGWRWNGELARRIVASMRDPTNRRWCLRAAVTEWSSAGLLFRAEEFHPLRPLYQQVYDRHYELDNGISSDRGTGHEGDADDVYQPIGVGLFCSSTGRERNGVKNVLHMVPTYLGLTR